MNWAPFISLPLLFLLFATGLLCVIILHYRQRRFLPARIASSVLSLRITFLVALTMVLLNPFRDRSIPDPDAYTIAILADAAASMLHTDTDNRTRLEKVNQLLDVGRTGSLTGMLNDRHTTRTYSFASRISASPPPFNVLPGESAIGDSLNHLLEQVPPRGGNWGAVILLSDGIGGGNIHPVMAARRVGAEGIPIHVVGIGETDSHGDLRIHFERRQLSGTRNETMRIPVLVANRFPRATQFSIELRDNDEQLDIIEVELPADATGSLEFEVIPQRGGLRSYSARILSDETVGNPLTNVDYAIAQIDEPRQYRVAYLGRPHPEFRFLSQLIAGEERYQLDAWIMTGKERVIRRGESPEGESVRQNAFPDDAGFLNEFDLVVVDAGIIAEFSSALQQGLVDFVMRAGGGIMMFGSTKNAGNQLQAVLPARNVQRVTIRGEQALVPVAGDLLREEDVLTHGRNRFPQASAEQWFHPGSQLARGARVALETRDGVPLITYHAYGAGRVVHSALEHIWQWRLTPGQDTSHHRRFWLSAIEWLAEARKPRLEVPFRGKVVPAGEQVQLDVRILDGAFRPRADARVRAIVHPPEGERFEGTMMPVYSESGNYRITLDGAIPGEYRVDLAVQFPDGEELRQTAFFLSGTPPTESDNAMDEALLRDIARLSGGEYVHWTDIRRLRDPGISGDIPLRINHQYWTRQWPWLILLLTIAGVEWGLRRRYGLR